jgi:MFS family permease
MVEDLGYGGEKLGYYAGGLAASFCGAQFCSSIVWGIISDKYGRKPAIILGTIGAGIGMVIYGSAKTYTQAVAGRMVGGFLCGNLGFLLFIIFIYVL